MSHNDKPAQEDDGILKTEPIWCGFLHGLGHLTGLG